MAGRIEKLSKGLHEKYEAFLVSSSVNRFYLTGFNSSAGTVIITKEQPYLLVDFRYGEAAKRIVKDAKVIVYDRFAEALKEICEKHSIKKMYVENDGITLGEANKYKKLLKNYEVYLCTDKTLDTFIKNMRIVKSKDEIEKITKAQRITEYAYNNILNYIKPGVKEKDIALELEFLMRKEGASAVSFDLITIAGKKTSLPHGVPGNEKVNHGDFVTMDIGAIFEGYHSDMTRTVGVSYLTDEQKEIYNIVLTAQLTALEKIKVGITGHDVDKAARDIIKKAGYGDYFGHATGHGVGLDIHEEPRILPKGKDLLSKGMIVTVEPGIYLPGKFGVRIEDMVCVTNSGCSNLTNCDKKLLIL